MSGDFNVVVATFGSGGLGRSASDEGAALAQTVRDHLAANLAEVQVPGSSIQVHPTVISAVRGSTEHAREETVRRTASQLNANVVVYGTVSVVEFDEIYVPEAYVLDVPALSWASEIAGRHEFAEVRARGGRSANPVLGSRMREEIVAWTTGLTEFVIALGYFDESRGDLVQAEEHFEAAELLWNDAGDTRIVELFLANISLKREDYSAAGRHFDKALTIAPGFGRARLGAAEVAFQNARGHCESGNTDEDGLRAALALFADAGRAPEQPLAYDMTIRVGFGTGRILLCMSQALIEDRFEDAIHELSRVVNAYDREPGDLKQLAAEAHAGLGLAYLPVLGEPGSEEKYRRSEAEFRKAIALTEDATQRSQLELVVDYIRARIDQRAAGRAVPSAIGVPLLRHDFPPDGEVSAVFAHVGAPLPRIDSHCLGSSPFRGCDPSTKFRIVMDGDSIAETGEEVVFRFVGFSPSDDVLVTVRRPDASEIGDLVVGMPSKDAWIDTNWTWPIPLGSPTGIYEIVAEQGGFSARGAFLVKSPSYPHVVDFEPSTGHPGTIFRIHVAGVPNSVVALWIYRLTNVDAPSPCSSADECGGRQQPSRRGCRKDYISVVGIEVDENGEAWFEYRAQKEDVDTQVFINSVVPPSGFNCGMFTVVDQ